jgi:PAS domain S-box-containing protein
LVVDDDRIGRLAVVKAIQRLGLSVREAGDAEAALACLREATADLIVLDVNMPGMSGFDLCVAIRALPGHKMTPVIFVTRLDDFESRSKSILVGGGELITKPFSFIELSLKALTHLLKGRLQRPPGIGKTSLASEQTSAVAQPEERSRSTPPEPDPTRPSIPLTSFAPEPSNRPSSNNLPPQRAETDLSLANPLAIPGRSTPAAKRPGTQGIITMNAEWVIESINAAAVELFGYRAHEVVGKNIDILLATELADSFKQLAKHPSSAEPGGQVAGRWVIGRRRDGTEFPAHWVVKDITISRAGRKTAIFRDVDRWSCVSERRIRHEFNERLEAAADQLARVQTELAQARSTAARVNMAPASANRSLAVPGQAALEERVQALLAQQTVLKAKLEREAAGHAEATQLAQDYLQAAGELERKLAAHSAETQAMLESVRQEAEARWAAGRQRLVDLEMQLSGVRVEMEAQIAQCQQAELRCQNLSAKVAQLGRDLAVSRNRLAIVEAERTEWQQRSEQTEAELIEMRRRLSELKARLSAQESARKQAEQAAEDAAQSVAELETRITLQRPQTMTALPA